MFATDPYLISQAYNQGHTPSALQHYYGARLRGQLSRVWSALTGRSCALHELSAVTHKAKVGGRQLAGILAVRIGQIRGTEGRPDDFDCDFNPLTDHTRARWLSVFTALARGTELPPVELIRAGNTYYVRDGHHRISAARTLGQQYIEAVVTAWA